MGRPGLSFFHQFHRQEKAINHTIANTNHKYIFFSPISHWALVIRAIKGKLVLIGFSFSFVPQRGMNVSLYTPRKRHYQTFD